MNGAFVILASVIGAVILGYLLGDYLGAKITAKNLKQSLKKYEDVEKEAKGYTKSYLTGQEYWIPPCPPRPKHRNPPPPKINPVKIKEGKWKSFEKQCEENAYSALEKRRKDFEERFDDTTGNILDKLKQCNQDAPESPTSVPNKELVETLVETNKLLRELLKKYDQCQ